MVNRFLVKVAEMIVNKDKSLPYRRRVEVAIFKDGKVLLTKNKDKESGDFWYGFPGGGTDGKTDEKTAHEECLEEVGVAIRDLEDTGILHTQEGIGNKNGRAEKYRGSKTRVFRATYLARDTGKLGADGDSVKYVWMEPEEAKKVLLKNKVNSEYRVKALGL